MTSTTAEVPFFEVFSKALIGDVLVTITGIPARKGHRCDLGEDCRYHETQTQDYRLGFAWTCQLRPMAPATTPSSAPAVSVAIRPARTTVPATSQRQPMTPVVKDIPMDTHVGTGLRGECWGATSTDGRWRYDREDDDTSPWRVTHVKTGVVLRDRFGTLARARVETYRLDHIAKPAAA